MEPTRRVPVERGALVDWCAGAAELISDLDSCWEMLDSMLCGTDVTDLVVAETLYTWTTKSVRWLVAYPCPEPWIGEHLTAIVVTFAKIGQMVVDGGSRHTDAHQTELVAMTEQARRMVGEASELMVRLT